jgi:predicted RecA/RadA family phage recombinase
MTKHERIKMKNYVQDGSSLTLTAPYTVTSGSGALIGNLFGIAAVDIASGVDGEFSMEGVFDIAALATDVGTQGAKVYWDNTAKLCTVVLTTNTLIGRLTKAKANGDTTMRVLLNEATA